MVYTRYMTPRERKEWEKISSRLESLYQEGVHYDAYEEAEEVLLGYRNRLPNEYDRTPDLLSEKWQKDNLSPPSKDYPCEWKKFNTQAEEGYYGFGSIEAFPSVFAIIDGGIDTKWTDEQRLEIIMDYLAYLQEKGVDKDTIAALERLLIIPRISFPAYWFANYYF